MERPQRKRGKNSLKKANKIKLALKLYPFYEAASGDLLFFSIIQTLFLTQVKGFSASQIATVILITDVVDLALEYPTYMVIRRVGNSRSSVIGGIMPLIGILFITFGQTLLLVAAGNIFFVSAGNFQSMAGAGARNNLVLLGEKEDYARLFSKGNTIYSAVSMISAVLIPFLFSLNRYLPSILCIAACGVIAVLSTFIPDYSEQGGTAPPSKEVKKTNVRIGKGLRLLLVVFCLFFCTGAVFTSNTEVFLGNRLGELFSEQKTIFIYGTVIWAARMLRLGSNMLLPRILDLLKDGIVLTSSVVMLIAFSLIAISGLLFRKTIIPVFIAGIAYVVVKGIIWDPLRTFLRMTAVDTNSKKRQQSMLVFLNAGQSVVSILMDLIVVGILTVCSLEYVFLVFSGISAIIVIFAVLLRKELKQQVEIMQYETRLNEREADEISQIIYDHLLKFGIESKEALSYRLLTEEKLLEYIKKGKTGEKLCVRLVSKLDDFHVNLRVGDEDGDIFMIPSSGDSISQQIFHNILRSL
jgi:hypothetical protein